MKKTLSKSASSNPPSEVDETTLLDEIIALKSQLPGATALPSTRALGLKLGCANTTIFRTLMRLVAEGVLWQHPVNGRFYPISARASLERPKPLACLIRRVELRSALYREFLEGISTGCGKERRTMLLWHDELLVNHPDLNSPPSFALPPEQKAILKDFLNHHGESSGGYILDHIWDDEALRQVSRKLQPAVLLYRRAPADLNIRNVYADFPAAAMLAITHLLGKGFNKIIPVQPFGGDPAVEEFLTQLESTVDLLGCWDKLTPRVPADMGVISESLKRNTRAALIVPEDHVAVRLCAELRAEGWNLPADAGVFCVMGTSVSDNTGISRLRFDFREMGAKAVSLLRQGTPQSISMTGILEPGNTT
jgi:hypothetical protein